MIESILLTTIKIQTFAGTRHLTNASGFFFEHGRKLYLVTSRHALVDGASLHHPDRIEIDLHIDSTQLARSVSFSIPLYNNGMSLWRSGSDTAGDIDVAMIEIDRQRLPGNIVYSAFTPAHLPEHFETIEIGSTLLVVGFPLGFHDKVHHLPVVRQAVIVSSFGQRFQGKGYFLTDARHRRAAGAGRTTLVAAGRALRPPGRRAA